ncbi:MAG: hypothetical protein KatS3mg014_0759 [Actinomycetota bacterium]|nr:MAG: hypothetical protein KatS3mg014_0759 [Actinomycetota bacterium]
MDVLRLDDPRAFLERARPLLAADPGAEARHNLILGVASTAAERPELYPVYRAWVALADGEPLAAASRTPPFHAILAEPRSEEALEAVVHALALDDPGTTGATRVATREDRGLLLDWLLDFAEEAGLGPTGEPGFLERMIDARIEEGSLVLWEDGAPVSLAGSSSPKPSGIRVGPVYTPPEHRRRGYATGLVAELSRWLLARGHRACYLYTDLANPTSNAVYVRIGYRRVADSAEIAVG